MIGLKQLYQLSFYILVYIVFMVGGVLQFFIGIPNTVMTLSLCGLMFFNYLIYVLIKKKIVFNKAVLFFALYLIVILASAFINKSDPISVAIYCIFPLLPLSSYLFFYINRKEGYIKTRNIYRLIFFIGIIQLPILLIQRNFFDILILFNNSGQNIASFDFLFGSFLLKSDHSLGCFIVLLTLSLLFDINGIRKHISHSLWFAVYVSTTLLLSESNISKALLILTWGIYLFTRLYHIIKSDKFTKKILFFSAAALIIIGIYNIRNVELITSRVGGTFEKHYTAEKSYRFFEKGTAKREQIVIAAINSLETEYIGQGPYTYFNIRTGEFKNTIHFSQLIWTYFDLGLIGLVIVLAYAYHILKSALAEKQKKLFFSILFLFAVYLFYTTPFSEIGILSSFFLFFNYNSKNEFSNNTLS